MIWLTPQMQMLPVEKSNDVIGKDACFVTSTTVRDEKSWRPLHATVFSKVCLAAAPQ